MIPRELLIGQVNLIRTSKEANPKEIMEELRNGEEEGEEIPKRRKNGNWRN